MKKKLLLGSALLLFCFMQSFAQQRTITGTVIASDGSPLAGASIVAVGQRTGETTASDGSFSIKVPEKVKSLRVSFIGYVTKDVSISGQSQITVSLQSEATNLNEIVVTGYTTQLKKDITGAVATVNVNDAKRIPATSSEQLLQGQAAGVTVLNSGQPGAPSTVFVRGISNFGQTQPLYVVDGVQVGDMSMVNPNDIQSISVLKDAGAAAIYGISGGNGVVVITTKKGKQGKATISYDGYYGTQRPLQGNVWNLMNPVQQSELTYRTADLTTQVLVYPGGSGTIPTYAYHGPSGSGGSFGPQGVTNDDGILQYYNFDANHPENDFLISKLSTTGTDWFHTIFRSAPEQSHTISASGGSDKSTYYFSANYVDQQGTMLNTYEKRMAARMNTSFNVKQHIRVGENAFVTFRKNNGGYNGSQQNEGGSISYTYREMPIIPQFDVAGNYGGSFAAPGSDALGQGTNPYAIQMRAASSYANFVTVEGSVFAEADFAKYFTARTAYGGLLYNQYYWGITYNPYDAYESHTNPNGANEHDQTSQQFNWTTTVTYKETFGKHNVQAFVGFEQKGYSGREVNAYTQNLFSLDPNYVQLQYGNQSATPATSYIYQPTGTLSVFGRVDYSYNDRYLLGATIRRDGFSIFYPGHQWGTFPSVSLGWRISQENFLKNVSWINDLKIRGSWGEAGNNANIGGNNAYTAFSSGQGTSYYGIGGSPTSIVQGFYNSQLGNQNTTWETDKITNIGIDVALFNHLEFTVEWYKKSISGLLFQDAQAPQTVGGATLPQVNIGDIQNQGLDVSATYHTRFGKDIRFSATANVTTYHNKITYIPGSGYFDYGSSRDLDITRNEIGHPIGAFFGYKVLGIYQSDADAAKGPTYSGAAAGSFIYQNTDGNDVVDANDRTFIGNPNPKFTYGLNVNLGYKKFDLAMVLYGSQGNDVFNYVKYWTDFYNTFVGGKSLDLYNKAAIVENGQVTNPGATLPAASFGQAMGSNTVSSFYVENGSFLKCRVLSLGYTFEPELIKRIGLDKLHFYVQATNLFTITKYSGLDPELIPSINVNGTGVNQNAAFGIDYGAYPTNQKQYIVGLNLSF